MGSRYFSLLCWPHAGVFFFFLILLLLPPPTCTVGYCSKGMLPPFLHLSVWFLFPSKMDSSPVFSVSEPILYTYVYLSSEFWLRLRFSIYLASYRSQRQPSDWKYPKGSPDDLYCPFSKFCFVNTITKKLSPATALFFYYFIWNMGYWYSPGLSYQLV